MRVPAETSRAEIERVVRSHVYGDPDFRCFDTGKTTVQFDAYGRLVRFEIPPTKSDDEYRQGWHTLFLIIKAKFEVVEWAIKLDSTLQKGRAFDREFLANIVVGGQEMGRKGRTVYEEIQDGVTGYYRLLMPKEKSKND